MSTLLHVKADNRSELLLFVYLFICLTNVFLPNCTEVTVCGLDEVH